MPQPDRPLAASVLAALSESGTDPARALGADLYRALYETAHPARDEPAADEPTVSGFTREQLATMSPADYAKNREAILRAS